MVNSKFLNPLFISVFLSAFIIYSNEIRIPEKNALVSLLPKEKIVSISGIISSSPSKTQNGKFYSCSVDVFSVKGPSEEISDAHGRTQALIPSAEIEAFFPGKIFTISENKGFYETGSVVCLYGKFYKGLFYTENSKSYGFGNGIGHTIKKIRALGRLKFKRLLYKWGDAGGLLLALLSGSREYTDPLVQDSFRKAGLSHILALSGMHLSLFSSLALFLGNLIGRKKIALIAQLLAVILFVWFAGFSPSLTRAFICISILLFQMIICIEKTDMLLVLCFSFFVQTILTPNDLLKPGFILSYGALSGILISGNFFRKLYSFIFPKYMANSLSASTGAQLITMPVSLKLFGQVSPIGIVSSVFVSPFVSLFIYSGLVFIVLGLLIPPVADAGGIFMGIQYNFITNMVGFFSKVPPFSFTL